MFFSDIVFHHILTWCCYDSKTLVFATRGRAPRLSHVAVHGAEMVSIIGATFSLFHFIMKYEYVQFSIILTSHCIGYFFFFLLFPLVFAVRTWREGRNCGQEIEKCDLNEMCLMRAIDHLLWKMHIIENNFCKAKQFLAPQGTSLVCYDTHPAGRLPSWCLKHISYSIWQPQKRVIAFLTCNFSSALYKTKCMPLIYVFCHAVELLWITWTHVGLAVNGVYMAELLLFIDASFIFLRLFWSVLLCFLLINEHYDEASSQPFY